MGDFDGFINPEPIAQPESAEFWDALGKGRFLIKHCSECDRAHWYPRARCPFCFSDTTEWREASGNGEIYSYSVMRKAKNPYILAYVTLDEGPTMMTDIVGADPDRLTTGTRVRMKIGTTAEGTSVPLFTPAD